GKWVVYMADQDLPWRDELYRVPADGSAPPAKLNTSLTLGDSARILHYWLSADGRRVVYTQTSLAPPAGALQRAPGRQSAAAAAEPRAPAGRQRRLGLPPRWCLPDHGGLAHRRLPRRHARGRGVRARLRADRRLFPGAHAQRSDGRLRRRELHR